MEHFKVLNAINCNDKVEKKDDLSYLSWTYAWAEVKKIYPNASYRVLRFENGFPYVCDPDTGFMVFTEVTIEELTHEMWLPVMNGSNKAMKNKSYEYTTKYGKKTVEPATMFDINKTIMRCLTKNLAMFGLGLYIYSGEDMPEIEDVPEVKCITQEQRQELFDLAGQELLAKVVAKYKYENTKVIPASEFANLKLEIETIKSGVTV